MNRILAMVALRSTDPLDWQAVAAGCELDPSLVAVPQDGPEFAFPIPGGTLGLIHEREPIAWDELEWPVMAAWHWPEAEAELRSHRSHVLVFASSESLSPVDLNIQLVRAVASVIAARPDAVAVYNPHASIVIEPGRYAAEARSASREALPILLWLGLHLVTDSVGLSGYTTGMEVFGLLNLEVHDTQWNPPDLLNLLASVAHYEISSGTQIGDGQSVGLSERQRVEIQHQPSRFGEGAVSCHLVLGLRAFSTTPAMNAAASIPARQYSAMVLGATGNVGRRIVQLLAGRPQCGQVLVVTRRPAGVVPDAKVAEVIVNMDHLEADLAPHATGIDIALAAFGVGKGSASMPDDEVRQIEIGYPLAFLRAAKAAGARVAGVMTAVGASPHSRAKYVRVIGEKEVAAESVGFEFLGLYRPAVILGNSNTPGVLNTLMPLLHWAMPSKYHSIHKNDIARAMVAQSEQALAALATAGAPRAAVVKRLEYGDMQPFFVPGDHLDS